MFRILTFSILGLAILIGLALAGEYSLSPSAAAIISPGNDDDPSTGQRVLVKFNLPEAMSGKQIGRAFITFTHNFSAMDGSGALEFKVFPLTSSWNAQDIDWDSWENDGGDFDKTKGYAFAFEPGSNTEFYIDVTEQVQLMAEGELTNHGFILIPGDLHGRGYKQIRKQDFNVGERVRLELRYR